jgi:hypothetical protein
MGIAFRNEPPVNAAATNLVDFLVDNDYYGNAQSFVQGNFRNFLPAHFPPSRRFSKLT